MIFKREPHPVYETIGLINFLHHREDVKEATIEALNHMGIEGRQFYETNFPLIEKLADDFAEKHVPHPDEDFLFKDESLDCTFSILACLLEYPDWLRQDFSASEEKVLHIWSQMVRDDLLTGRKAPDLSTLEGRIAFLEEQDMTDGAKWNAMVIFNNPVRYTRALAEICRLNLPAYDYAVSRNKEEMESFIAAFCTEQIEHEPFLKALKELNDNMTVYPSMASPLAEWGLDSCCFYGVLVNKAFMFDGIDSEDQAILLSALKILSDKTKFSILTSLRKGEKYNLEIAEEAEISTATASHHMGILLSSAFVTIEKREGKVYYAFAPEKIRQIITLLEKSLLM